VRWHVDTTPNFKVGDPCPDGYIARAEWAEVHLKAGLKQKMCGRCLKWMFPHELSTKRFFFFASRTKHGVKEQFESVRCKSCANEKKPTKRKRPRKSLDTVPPSTQNTPSVSVAPSNETKDL
jgi:hypothetical protein